MNLPSNTCDIVTAKLITEFCGIWSEDEKSQLLEWVQDGNWPVAQILLPHLANSKQDLNLQVLQILKGHDYVWMYWVIELINAAAINEELFQRLTKIAFSPNQHEIDEGLPEKAQMKLSERDLVICRLREPESKVD